MTQTPTVWCHYLGNGSLSIEAGLLAENGRSDAVELLLTRDSGLVIKLGMKEGLFDVC